MNPIAVAVDAMGGDHAPDVVVEGAVQAARTGGGSFRLLLVGPEDVTRPRLDALGASDVPVEIVHAPDVVGMAESPSTALKTKPQSSMHVGVGLVKDGTAHAFVTAGNTGAAMAISLFGLGRVPGVARPSLVGFFPTVLGRPCLVLDVGSNVDCRPEHLVQFARMGSVYAQRVLGVAAPRVGLMNVGEEPGKGNDLAKETYPLLAQTPGIVFSGNVEGRDVLAGVADVIVMDGFVGNVLLKFGESLKGALPQMMGAAMQRLGLDDVQRSAMAQVLGAAGKGFDYESAGGAPLLGVAGNVVIGHGSSSAKAIASMIRAGAAMAEANVASALAEALVPTA